MNLPILKYYIGHKCEFITSTGERFIHELTGHIYEVLKSGDTTYVSVKPVVRRLAAMTEEEIIELFRLRRMAEPERITRTGIDHGFIQIEYTQNGEYGSDYQDLITMRPTQFHYLLSRSFDLFNLLDKGEGIEADSLKEKV